MKIHTGNGASSPSAGPPMAPTRNRATPTAATSRGFRTICTFPRGAETRQTTEGTTGEAIEEIPFPRDRGGRHDSLEVVGTAGDRVEAVQLARTVQPHTVVLDLGHPQADGTGSAEQPR